MPTLFISYKRGTSAVAPLMEKLRDAHYRLWFDRDEIHLGDPDWQARINQGIQRCDGLILNLTPAACASEPVQYEVKTALALGKPIFPLVLERISDWGTALTQVGLTPNQHTEDFTDVTRWDEQIARLLRDLELQGLRVTRHDRRQQRDRSNPNYVLHQTYLTRLAERIGTLNLAQINPDNAQGVELERVYVDSPTGLGLSIEVQNWQVVDWWISEGQQQERGLFGFDDDDKKPDEPRRKPHDLGYETAPFETLIGGIDARITAYRQEYPDKKPDERYSWQNPWNNGIKRNLINLHLNHLAAARDRLVILGAPGSGKSTFVKFLALCLAGSGMDDWTRQASIAALDNWPHGALTPIYIELRRLVVSKHFPADVKTPATADHLWAYIQHEVLGEALAAYADDLRYDLEHGHAVLILDGLDEVPYPEGKLKQRQQQLISLAQSLNTRYATSRIIVSSRPYAYEGWTLPGFQAVTITEFEDDHRTALASRLYRTAGLDEDAAKAKAQALNQQLRQIDDELKDHPLFVTLMATIYLRGDSEGLPTRRGALYRESILLLLDRWTQSKPGAPSLIELLGDKSLDDLYARLAALAYEVHEQYGEKQGTPEIEYEKLIKYLKPLGKHVAVDLVSYLSENAGVLVCLGQDDEKDVFHFAHRTFQEYLAAAHLMTRCAEADSFGLVRELIMSKPQVWRVPCVLAGDVLADTDRRGDLWDLLDDLLDDEIAKDMAADDPRWWTVWLDSVILQEQKLLESDKLRRSEKAVADQLRDWLLALIPTPQALPPVERALCGRALSLLDDPRPGVGTMTAQIDGKTAELPQLEWCEIPAPPDGVFIMGADNQSHNLRREVELKYSFKMGKYLVTYQQFQTFVDSGEYDQPEWWVGFPPEYQQQEMANHNNPYRNHPRERVSWYQAVAFCRWLTVKCRAAGLIGDKVEIRLPTEQEWEYAARGTDERTYPYPGDFDATKGNTSETGIGQTSAVGLFPDGASPFGVLDMSGNLFEWCLNDYIKPEIIDGYGNGESKVLRGGSFSDFQNLAAASYRDCLSPLYRHYFFGFRVVVAAPIASLNSGALNSDSE
jgi:formylglycine-generating enzyme required for sulfatase activity/energy-coupling factor transporter ATP-binding protein EcfA2